MQPALAQDALALLKDGWLRDDTTTILAQTCTSYWLNANKSITRILYVQAHTLIYIYIYVYMAIDWRKLIHSRVDLFPDGVTGIEPRKTAPANLLGRLAPLPISTVTIVSLHWLTANNTNGLYVQVYTYIYTYIIYSIQTYYTQPCLNKQ